MSDDGTERVIFRRTVERELDDAIERMSRRKWGMAGARGREIVLEYEYGYGQS